MSHVRGHTLYIQSETSVRIINEVRSIMDLMNEGKVITAYKKLEDLNVALIASVPSPETSAKENERERVTSLKKRIANLVECL